MIGDGSHLAVHCRKVCRILGKEVVKIRAKGQHLIEGRDLRMVNVLLSYHTYLIIKMLFIQNM